MFKLRKTAIACNCIFPAQIYNHSGLWLMSKQDAKNGVTSSSFTEMWTCEESWSRSQHWWISMGKTHPGPQLLYSEKEQQLTFFLDFWNLWTLCLKMYFRISVTSSAKWGNGVKYSHKYLPPSNFMAFQNGKTISNYALLADLQNIPWKETWIKLVLSTH
jgi:hypothetical protein